MAKIAYGLSVFVNCPFDDEFKPYFHAIVFAIYDCGFVPRSAWENDDSSEVRIEKICDLIKGSKYGIHDISRTELDVQNQLPRFNMPFELGLFLGAKKFGLGYQKQKLCLILDRDPHRYVKFLSDIRGQDIKSHGPQPNSVIPLVRDWLANCTRSSTRIIPGGREIQKRYGLFLSELPSICDGVRIGIDEFTFNDYCNFVSSWLRKETASPDA